MQIPMPSPIDSGSRTSSIPRRKNCGSQSRRGLAQIREIFGTFKFRSYGVICWYGPKPIAPRIQSSGLAFGPSASRALRQPR